MVETALRRCWISLKSLLAVVADGRADAARSGLPDLCVSLYIMQLHCHPRYIMRLDHQCGFSIRIKRVLLVLFSCTCATRTP